MVSAADAEAFRQAQIGIRVLVERDLDRLWMRIWSKDAHPGAVRDGFLRAVPTLVARYGEDAANLAAEWYEVQRGIAGVGGAFTALPVASPYLDVVEPMVRRTAGALWTPTPEAMLTGLKAATGKYVLGAARATITANTDRDPRAVGWKRITRAKACEFCRMLAGRGGVYTRESVHFASHGDCNCGAAPEWDPSAQPVDVGAYTASERTSAMTPEQKALHTERVHSWMETHAGDL